MSFGRPEYLLFLKRRQDGKYEPLSGRVDPALSIREVFHPRYELGEDKEAGADEGGTP